MIFKLLIVSSQAKINKSPNAGPEKKSTYNPRDDNKTYHQPATVKKVQESQVVDKKDPKVSNSNLSNLKNQNVIISLSRKKLKF